MGQKDKKKQDSSFSKLTVASRVVKIENQLTHLERKLDHLIHMYRKDKTQAIHSMHVQHAISSSEDESGTPLSRQQRVPPSQLFVKTRQMDLLSPIISRFSLFHYELQSSLKFFIFCNFIIKKPLIERSIEIDTTQILN